MWEVKLRQGVKFHNGEPFDATAVKFSFERINRADFKSPQKGWFATIEAVEIVDPYTVRFHTKVPDPAMPARMTLMYQLAPKYVAQVGDAQANLKPVGTGPFKFVEWVKNDKIVVEANDAHWTGKPAVRRATWRPIPELGARIAALQTGQADLIVNVPPDQLQQLAATKTVHVEKMPSCRIIYFGLAQIKGGPIADRRVRQAINHAVDVQGDHRQRAPRQRQADQLVHAAQCLGLRSVDSVLRVQPQEGQGAPGRGGADEYPAHAAGAERPLGHGQGHRAGGGRPAHGERDQDQREDHRRVGELRPLGPRSQDRGHLHERLVPARASSPTTGSRRTSTRASPSPSTRIPTSTS